MTWFHIMTSAAQTKGKAKMGRYKNVAVVEIEDGHEMPRMISTRAKGLVRIVRYWPSCSVGTTERCAYAIAMREAQELVDQLTLDHRRAEPQHTAYGTHAQGDVA